MALILRSWLAFAALGAGVLHLALAPGSPAAIALILVPLGAFEFGWGLAVLARGRLVWAAAVRWVALAPILSWAALLLVVRMLGVPEFADSPSAVPMGVASVFDFVIAISLNVHLRRGRARGCATERVNAWAQLGGLFAGGLAVSLVMTPALTFTQAGLTNPHATHRPAISVPATEFEHGGH